MKRILSIVLSICIVFSAMGAMPVLATTASVVSSGVNASGGGCSGGSASLVITPTVPSTGGGSSAPALAEWNLYSNGIECNSGSFFAGDLMLEGYITTIDTTYDVLVVLAQYDNSGSLVKIDIRRKTVSATDAYLYATLNNVSVTGKVKAMVLRANNLMPLSSSKEYSAYGRSFVISVEQLEYNIGGGVIYYDQVSCIEYYENDTASKTTKAEIAAGAIVTVNGTRVNYDQIDIGSYMGYNSKLRLIENTGDKYFDAVAVTVYEYGIVDEVLVDKERINFVNGTKVIFDSGDTEQIADIYDMNGNRITLGDIKPGDVLAMVVGDIDYDDYIPLYARVFENKITIYRLDASMVSGTIVGWDSDNHTFYINEGVPYRYSLSEWATVDQFMDIIATGEPLGVFGDFYLDMDGKIIGFVASKQISGNYGFIIQSHYSTIGFTDQYQLKLLTATDGVVVYNVDTTCVIDSIEYEATAGSYGDLLQSTILSAFGTEYANGIDSSIDRLINYELNSAGEIDEIGFVNNLASAKIYTASDHGFNSATSKIGSKLVNENTMTFDVMSYGRSSVSSLIDGTAYAGILADLNDDNEMDIFVVQNGELTPEVVEYETKSGFVIAGMYSTAGFDTCYKLQVITEDQGVVTYDVDTNCSIDGVEYSALEQDMLNFAEYDSVNDSANACSRLISYSCNDSGQIDTIDFISDNADIVSATGVYDSASGTIGGAAFNENPIVFYVDFYDVTESIGCDISNLVDENEYVAYIINSDIILILSGEMNFENLEQVFGGFIIQSHFNTTGFTGQYQLKLLTAEQGVVVYDVDTECEIDGQYCLANRQQSYLDFAEYDNYTNSGVTDRLITCTTNVKGEIDEIQFADTLANSTMKAVSNAEYIADASMLGGELLGADIEIFDVSGSEFQATDISGLYDGCCYEGVLADIDGDDAMDIFVMTAAEISFEVDGNLFVVDSVMSILRDGQYATQVKYYTDGINDLKTAIFTEDSINALGYSDEFETLSKGSVFTAITDANGLVNCYAVITSLDYHGVYDLVGDLKPLTQSIYGISEVNCKGDGVEFVYGYITNIRGKTITLGGTLPAGYTGDISADSFENGRDFVINARTAQYCYNTEGVKPKIVVGDYLSTGVDVYDDGKANLVLLKVYDDEVIDIISFSRRMIAPEIGIVAQTHYTGPALDIN